MSCKDILYRAILISSLFAVNGIVTAATFTFNSPLTSTLVTEGGSVFNGSVNYTPGLWAPGEVTSAILSIQISDDISSNFPPAIDSPREWAQINSVNDGGSFLIGPPTSVEVEPNFFTNPPFSDLEVTIATNAGIENPSLLPSSAWYFDLDVSSVLNASNTGTLDFSLIALAMYPDVTPLSDPAAYALISAISGITPVEFLVIEDFNFEQARLTVDVASEVPLPPAVWLFATGLVSLLLNNRRTA